MNAARLVLLSVRESRVVSVYPDASEASALLEDLGAIAADDCPTWEHHSGSGRSGPESAGHYDVWGTADGNNWRIHVVCERVESGV
jgi:hypothetical protein